MTIYTIRNKDELKKLIVNGISPRKTLAFDIFGYIVTVTLTYDSEMELIFVVDNGCNGKKSYYENEWEKFTAYLDMLFDTYQKNLMSIKKI